jgi:hypothetical protein
LQGGILCRIPENVHIANQPAVAKSDLVLQAMGCLRMQAGIRSHLLDRALPGDIGDTWRVLIYDRRVPSTILWGLPKAFARAETPTMPLSYAPAGRD